MKIILKQSQNGQNSSKMTFSEKLKWLAIPEFQVTEGSRSTFNTTGPVKFTTLLHCYIAVSGYTLRYLQ